MQSRAYPALGKHGSYKCRAGEQEVYQQKKNDMVLLTLTAFLALGLLIKRVIATPSPTSLWNDPSVSFPWV